MFRSFANKFVNKLLPKTNRKEVRNKIRKKKIGNTKIVFDDDGDVIGPNGNYSDLPNFSKLSLSLGMLLGRLELFAVLVLFFPSFWKN